MNPIPVGELHKGDIVFECSQYGSVQVILLTEPELIDGKFEWSGWVSDRVIKYLVVAGSEHYGPRFYREPAYLPIEYLAKIPSAETLQ